MDWLRRLWGRFWRDRGEWTRVTAPPVAETPRVRPPAAPRHRSKLAQANAAETCRLFGHSLWHNVCVICYEHVEDVAVAVAVRADA